MAGLSSLALPITNGSTSNGRNRVIIASGSPSVNPLPVSITPTAIQKNYTVINNSAYGINFSNGSGSSYTVPANSISQIVCDGAGNVIPANQSPVSSIVAFSALAGGSGWSGYYSTFYFGSTAGERFALAFAYGTATDGNTLSWPGGFVPISLQLSANTFAIPAGHYVNQGLVNYTGSLAAPVIHCGFGDGAGNNSSGATVNFFAVLYGTNL